MVDTGVWISILGGRDMANTRVGFSVVWRERWILQGFGSVWEPKRWLLQGWRSGRGGYYRGGGQWRSGRGGYYRGGGQWMNGEVANTGVEVNA